MDLVVGFRLYWFDMGLEIVFFGCGLIVVMNGEG